MPYGFLLAVRLNCCSAGPPACFYCVCTFFSFYVAPYLSFLFRGIKYAVHVRRPKMRVVLSFFHEFYALLCALQQILFLSASGCLFLQARAFLREILMIAQCVRSFCGAAGRTCASARTHAAFFTKDWNISGCEIQKTTLVSAPFLLMRMRTALCSAKRRKRETQFLHSKKLSQKSFTEYKYQ